MLSADQRRMGTPRRDERQPLRADRAAGAPLPCARPPERAADAAPPRARDGTRRGRAAGQEARELVRVYCGRPNAMTLSPVTGLPKNPPPVAVITTYCFPSA